MFKENSIYRIPKFPGDEYKYKGIVSNGEDQPKLHEFEIVDFNLVQLGKAYEYFYIRVDESPLIEVVLKAEVNNE